MHIDARRLKVEASTLLLAICALSVVRNVQVSKTELEGTWIAKAMTVDGTVRTLQPGDMTYRFAGDKLFAVNIGSPDEHEFPFVVDAKASPKHLDYSITPTRKILAVYSLEENKLTIGTPRPPKQDRPTDMSTDKGSGVVVVVFERRASAPRVGVHAGQR